VGRNANVHAAVSLRRDLVLEPQIKVGKLFSASQPGTGRAGTQELPVMHLPALFGRFTTALPACQVLSIEEAAKTKLSHLQRPKLKLASFGNFTLQADVTTGLLEAAHFVRLFPINRQGDRFADDRDVERVPLARLNEPRARRPGQISNVPLFPLQEIDL